MFNDAGGVLSNNEPVFVNESLVLHPNPTSGVFTIAAAKTINDVDLIVYDVLGNKIVAKHLNSLDNETVDLSGFGSGVYFVAVGGEFFRVLKR